MTINRNLWMSAMVASSQLITIRYAIDSACPTQLSNPIGMGCDNMSQRIWSATWIMVRKVSWSSCLKVGMTLSSLIITDTGICRNLDGTSTMQGSFRAWSCTTTTWYKSSRQSASLSLNVFVLLRNEGGICIWASSELLQYLSQTSTRSNISVCSTDCFSSWQSRYLRWHCGNMFCLSLKRDYATLVICSICSVTLLTHVTRTLRTWSYFGASSILLLNGNSWIRWSDSLLSCWQKMHYFQSMWGVSPRRLTFWWWACCMDVEELGSFISFNPAFLKRSTFDLFM